MSRAFFLGTIAAGSDPSCVTSVSHFRGSLLCWTSRVCVTSSGGGACVFMCVRLYVSAHVSVRLWTCWPLSFLSLAWMVRGWTGRAESLPAPRPRIFLTRSILRLRSESYFEERKEKERGKWIHHSFVVCLILQEKQGQIIDSRFENTSVFSHFALFRTCWAAEKRLPEISFFASVSLVYSLFSLFLSVL